MKRKSHTRHSGGQTPGPKEAAARETRSPAPARPSKIRVSGMAPESDRRPPDRNAPPDEMPMSSPPSPLASAGPAAPTAGRPPSFTAAALVLAAGVAAFAWVLATEVWAKQPEMGDRFLI